MAVKPMYKKVTRRLNSGNGSGGGWGGGKDRGAFNWNEAYGFGKPTRPTDDQPTESIDGKTGIKPPAP